MLGSILIGLLALASAADDPPQATAPATEQNPAVPAAGHSLHGEAFDEGPRQKATIKDGQGKIQFPVTTARPEAQAFFNQGVGQLHSFYYLEAERSFRQVAQIDPLCPMAYWGMAMANVNNANRGRGFAQEAQKKAKATPITRREQLYLDALTSLYKDKGEHKPEFLHAMETVVQECPEDIDAKAWLAMLIWQAGKLDSSRQAVDALIQSVEAVEPMHPGAHHYRIHLWDSVNYPMALRSAETYAKTAPGIAHAWHMPGHTFTGLKRYAEAAYQQEGSARVDHAAMLRDRVMPFEIHNYAHNNQWLATSLSHVGRARDAIAVARNLVEQPRDPQKNTKSDGGSAQRSGRARWSELLVKFELWDALIEATESGDLDWSDVPQEKREKAYTLGLAYAAKGEAKKLHQQVEALQALDAGGKKGEGSPEANELEGHEKLLRDDVAGAFDLFLKSKRMRGESLARAHLKARNFGFAPGIARKAVADAENQVAPLLAGVEVLQACGKVDEARAMFAKLEPLASRADRDLPAFQRVNGIAEGWKKDGWNRSEPASQPDPTTDLATLGPLVWTPYPAEPIVGVDSDGKPWNLGEKRGKNVLVVFNLGGGCAHCMDQLKALSREQKAFDDLKTEVVAVTTDDAEGNRTLKNNPAKIAFPMPILGDPEQTLFKAYHSFDDFESMPLHGTFLIDAEGNVRFQKVGPEPMLDVEFLKQEARRLQHHAP